MATAVEEFEIRPEVIVQAFDIETTIEAFSLNDIEEFYIEHGGVTDPLGQLSSAILNFIDSAISSAVSSLRGAIHSVESSIRGAISGIRNAVVSAVNGVRSAILSAISNVQSLVSSVSSAVHSIGSSILSSISSAVSTVTSTVSSILSSVQSIGQSIIGTIQSTFASVQQTIQSLISNVISAIQNIASQIQSGFQSVISAIQGAVSSFQQAIQSMANSVVSAIQSMVSQIQSGFQTLINTIQSVVANIQQALQSFATNIVSQIQVLVAQVQSAIQSVVEAIQGAFSNLQQTLQNILSNVVSTIQGLVTQIQSGFQGLINTIHGLITRIQEGLRGVITQITATLQGLWQSMQQALQSVFTQIIGGIDWIKQQVTKIPQLPALIWEHIKPFLQPFFDIIKDIPNKMAEISKAFQGFVNPLVGIAQFFDQIRQKFIDFVTNIPNYIKTIADFFGNIVRDPLGWFSNNVVKPLADAFSEIGKWIWEHLPEWFKNAITTAQQWFSNAVDWITKGWQGFVDWISKIPEHIQNLGKYIYDNAIKPLQDWFNEHVVKPLSDFIKPIIDVFGLIENKIKEFLKDPLGAVAQFFQNVWNAVKGAISTVVSGILSVLSSLTGAVINATKNVTATIFSTTTTFLADTTKAVMETFWGALTALIDATKALRDKIGEYCSRLISSVFETIYKNVAQPVEKAVLDLIKKVTSGRERGQIIETFGLMGTVLMTFIGSEYVARGTQIALRKLAGVFNKYEKTFTVRVRGRGEAKGEPVGVGAGADAGGGGGFTYTMRFNLGYPLKKLADDIMKYPDEYRRAIIYGMSIWASQPMMRLSNALWRNVLPVELPSLGEMREITRRHMPVGEKFGEFLSTMRRYLTLYGYNDEVIGWLTTPITEEGWYVTITDRFGNSRKVPISLLYELPTPSDIARMMIHDLFTVPDKPEIAFNSFKTLMSMKGFYEDIAKFYYLLHYKYPSMSDLWEFACRVVAKQTWVNVTPTKEEDLGASTTYSPIQLQDKYGITSLSSEGVASKLNEIVNKVLKHYAKWHDYAPFAWLEGWTADNLIYLDLMADIPQRIDARWMYKWQVPVPKEISDLTKNNYFDEKALFLIVTSRGMHPRWLESITIAECMNALAEERTYARTGVINAFKEGFMTLEGVNNTLSHLTDVKILGKNVPVRFLDGEVKLLTLRAKFDRALDILRDYFRDLLRGVTENMLDFSEMMKNLKDMVTAIAKALGLTNLALDESYYKLYGVVAETLRKVRTVERIRYWYRYMLYRILYRFSEGFMSKEEFDQTINEIVNNAKLTDEERMVFVEIANLMYDGFYKKTLADAILHKVRRGVIAPEKAKEELMKLGLSEDLAEALIEKSSKIYTLSVSQLISYAEYVDIPEDYVKQKLKWMGVPEDEIPIILQVFKIRPIKDERAKMIRSVIDAYINGYITKELFQKNLKNLGESDREVQILTEFADFEKSQAEAKLAIDAILNRLRRGAITLDEAKKELSKYIVDKALIDAIIEKYVRTSVWTPDKLVSMAEYVPIDIDKLVEKATMFGYPEDEVQLYPAYLIARNLNEEIGRVINELVYLYVYDIIDEETLRQEIDKVRTLNGEVKKLGVDWIVIDDIEKELIVQRAKLRKMREQYKS